VELGVVASKAALLDAKISSESFAHSIFGNVCAVSSADGPYLARHIALRSGIRQSAGSLTVNRLCGSGFEAIAQAQSWVSEGPCLVGGAENMSLTPLLIRNVREGFKFTMPPPTIDSLWEALNDKYAQMAMGETAEKLAQDYSITREECDRWALLSHQRAYKAHQEGLYSKEMVSVEVVPGKNVAMDEHIRGDSSFEKLSKLKASFKGVTTAGNASGINDAAAALVVADEEFTKKWSKETALKPLARVKGVRAVGCDPTRMGLGPVAAIEGLLKELNWTMAEIDYLEINEAFAAQVLAVKKLLKLSDEQLNPHGSGISIGHPLGATGARISTHMAHLLGSGLVKRAVGAACIGGGQGIALAMEAV
jgi:acetyl-CoA acetyltransferase family protein